MKLRSLILTLVAAIAASCLSGCVVVPARGYIAGPPMVVHHGWGYGRGYYDRR